MCSTNYLKARLLILDLTVEELRSFHFHPYNKRKRDRLKINDFLFSFENAGCNVSDHSNIYRERHTRRDTATEMY